MKKNCISILLLMAAISSGEAIAQTNAKIQESFFAGTQVANNNSHEFQGEVDYPERFLEYTHEGDRMKFTCDNGYAEISYHDQNIVHFTYYHSYKSRSYGWGIKPSTKMIKTTDSWARHNHRHFKSQEMIVDIDPITASVEYKNIKGETFLKCAGYHMKPVRVQGEESYQLSLSFDAPEDEAYYGLGQHQSGWMDQRGETVQLWHDYNSKDGEIIAIPFLLTNKNYAIVYDNPSRTKVACGVNGKTTWTSEMGEAISYYVIYGETMDDIFKSYGELCGFAPLPPKKALGYIQCKQRYATQKEVLDVANGYVKKNYPIDYMVVDWFHWDKLGDMSLNPKFWQDPAAMNRELKSNDINCMISCWPRFVKESKNFNILNKNGWLMTKKDGNAMNGTAWDKRGAVIDTSNPEAAEWYWNIIKKNYVDKGFDSYWLDESEPDVIPHSYYLNEGLGARVYNLYPYYHAKSIYNGQRSEMEERVFILTRSAYLGTHQFGTTFWSSDIYPEWDVFKRQIACGINVAASGMPYWSSDIGGWQGFQQDRETPNSKLLISSETGPDKMYKDYVEMYVRWFQYGAFCPTFRAHGTRSVNEVWSYGEKAEKILVNFLNLRYKLMPYIYSNAWKVTTENAPFMRALFMDFMDDKGVSDIKDQFLFGRSIMVAPITDPGETKRAVYLPKGSAWYDLWTNKRYEGGRSVTMAAPIERMPLLVKAGSIIPKSDGITRANQVVKELDIYIYPGADCEYELYSDDAKSYAYEGGEYTLVKFSWDDDGKVLSIGASDGEYADMVKSMTFNIVVVGSKTAPYNERLEGSRSVEYRGKAVTVKF